ncbi:Uncharacterised protein [Vibrio cholerae]|nr:Uncharacterised protein [Vibrio cholerae]
MGYSVSAVDKLRVVKGKVSENGAKAQLGTHRL